ncbi:MAG: SPOR domain-containing protein [bacterium]
MISRALLALAALLAVGLAGCGEDAAKTPAPDEGGALSDGLIPEGQDGKPTFGATGEPEEKADAVRGARGISAAYDNSATQVWAVTNDWEDTTTAAARKAGMAWPADSGLNWNQKYSRWVDQMQKTRGEAGYYDTYTLITPYGKTLPAPAFECAESGLFLRALFASWYGLPFIMEARTSGGARLYLGHMGFRTDSAKYGNTPDFKSVYRDYSDQAESVANGGAWPSDSRLRGRKLAGGFDDEQPALGIDDAHAGTYLDELLLNKRVGYFMIYLLSYFGSVNVADTRNTYNRKAESIRTGDLILHRYGYTGIGHTLIVKEVTVSNGQYAVELMSGSMPRRQPDWEDANGSRYSLVYNAAGSSVDSGDGVYAKFGGGLKGWRIPKKIDGKWTMVVPASEQSDWIDSSDLAAIGARVEKFREILTTLTPEQKRAVILERVQAQRDHLSRYPASCSARHRRGEALQELYGFEADELGRSQAEVDAELLTLADYVFGELVYEKSKTCCWNSTNEAMYEIIMQYAAEEVADHTDASCHAPTVFKAENGGYDRWKRYAESIGRGAEWKAWSEDESCPQRGVANDTEAEAVTSDWCAVGTGVLGTGDGEPGTVAGYRIQLGAWSSLDAANEVVEFVNDWFAAYGSDSDVRAVFAGAPAIDVFADETLYKVRVGEFVSREAAEAALPLVRSIREDFSGAWIVGQ